MTRILGGFMNAMIFTTAALAEPPHALDYRTISLNGNKGGTLAIVDGQPRLVNSPSAWNEWTLRETDKGWTIQGRLSREKPEPRYLSVDGEGNVTLVAEPGDGAFWKLTRKGDRMNSFDAAIQASGGKFDGWYLDFSDKQEKIEKGRFKYEAYRVTLSEKPGPRTNLHIFIDCPCNVQRPETEGVAVPVCPFIADLRRPIELGSRAVPSPSASLSCVNWDVPRFILATICYAQTRYRKRP